jgi:hypothetical protein
MLSFRCKRGLLALGALGGLFACVQEPPPPPPLPPADPSVSAKELNALAAPVIPKPGSGIKLKTLARPAESTATPTESSQSAATQPPAQPAAVEAATQRGPTRALARQSAAQPPSQAAPLHAAQQAAAQPGVQPPNEPSLAAPSLAPIVPPPQAVAARSRASPGLAAKLSAQPAQASAQQPAAPAENLDALVNPVLPGTKLTPKPVARAVLDRNDLAALSADLPPPPPETKPAREDPQPRAADPEPRPSAAEPALDPNNTFAAVIPSGERKLSAGTPAAWLITQNGIGSLRPGARLLPSGDDLASRYITATYSTGQPIEGFAFEEPPVFIAVRNGPFAAWGRAHRGERVPEAIQQRAVEDARAGKLVISMLIVTEKGPKTDRGVGVGDSYASFMKAYPGAGTPAKFPPLWEDPTCVITQKALWFFFDRCDDKARVARIMVRGRR